MKFKTTIEIITEAEDKNEAVEIAGDYLSGNIVSGVGMKCNTWPVQHYKRAVVLLAAGIILLVSFGALISPKIKYPEGQAQIFSGTNAIQPPLRTYVVDHNSANFKKEWQVLQAKEALHSLKKR